MAPGIYQSAAPDRISRSSMKCGLHKGRQKANIDAQIMKSLSYCIALVFPAMVLAGEKSAVEVPEEPDFFKRWAFDYGVAFITSQNIGELLGGEVDFDDGPAGGEIHCFTASALLAEPKWCLGGNVYRPALELPLTLGIIDENARSPFTNYSASFNVRWRDFPWNERIRTSFSMGIGLGWSSEVYAMDVQRHPDEYRSKWKLNWPIQLTFARPSHPQHQLQLFVAHQSGGRIFDKGGVNSLGFGYRFATW
jgi:hypothetical protein